MGSAFSSRGLGIFKVYSLSLFRTLVVIFALLSFCGVRSQAQQWPGPGSNPDACSAEEFGCESIGTTCAINFVMPYTCGIDGGGGTCRFTLTVCCYDCKNGMGENKIVIKNIKPSPDNSGCTGVGFDPATCYFRQDDVWDAVDYAIKDGIKSGCLPCIPLAEVPPCNSITFPNPPQYLKIIQYKAPCWVQITDPGFPPSFYPCTADLTCVKEMRFCIGPGGVIEMQNMLSYAPVNCPTDPVFQENVCTASCN